MWAIYAAARANLTILMMQGLLQKRRKGARAMLAPQSRIEGEAVHSMCLRQGKVIGQAHATF
jgi:hypothetical protein